VEALLIQTGIVGAVLAVMLALVRIAVRSEQRRADDWRTAAQTSAAANAVMANNIERLITSVEQLATSQREMMSLLQAMAHEPRSAA